MSEKYLPLSGVKSILREYLPEDELFQMTELISVVPPADVAPVVHGHWKTPEKQFPYWDWKCSVCGCEEYKQRDSRGNYRRMNFCPNRGAKMDESEEKEC